MFGSGLPEPYANSTRSQPFSSCARARRSVYSLSKAGPERAVISEPSLVAAIPRNSTGMALRLLAPGLGVNCRLVGDLLAGLDGHRETVPGRRQRARREVGVRARQVGRMVEVQDDRAVAVRRRDLQRPV